jgi:hypothetical protein
MATLRLDLTIDCEGAAFDPYANDELARILGDLACHIENAAPDLILRPEGVSLFDVNGNRCGNARISAVRKRRNQCR